MEGVQEYVKLSSDLRVGIYDFLFGWLLALLSFLNNLFADERLRGVFAVISIAIAGVYFLTLVGGAFYENYKNPAESISEFLGKLTTTFILSCVLGIGVYFGTIYLPIAFKTLILVLIAAIEFLSFVAPIACIWMFLIKPLIQSFHNSRQEQAQEKTKLPVSVQTNTASNPT